MTVLLATIGSAGDVLPFLAIGAELRRRGHEVEIATSPYFAERAAAAGLPLFPLGTVEDYEASVRDPDLFHGRRGFEVVMRRGVRPAVRTIGEWIRAHDPAETTVVASTLCLGALAVREAAGHRLATVHLQAAVLRSTVDPPVLPGLPMPRRAPRWLIRALWRLADRMIDRVLAPAVNGYRGELGLPPIRSILGSNLHSPDLVLGLYPDWFAPPPPDAPPQLACTGFVGEAEEPGGLDPELEAWLASGEPPLVFTPGTANAGARAFFEAGLGAAVRLGRRAVFLTPHAAQLPAGLPSEVRPVAWAPLSARLARAAALVHHGGIGTTARGLAAGIPQVVMPMAHDQPDTASRRVRLGVGASLPPRRFRPGPLARALSRLLADPGVGSRAREFAARVDFAAARDGAIAEIEALRPGPAERR